MEFLVLLFGIFTVIFPALFVNRIIFLIIIAIFSYDVISKRKRPNLEIIAPIVIVSLFSIASLNLFFKEFETSMAIRAYLINFNLFLIYIIKEYQLNFEELIKKIGICHIIFTILTSIYYIVFPNHYMETIFPFLDKYSYIAIGTRSFSEYSHFMYHLGAYPISFLAIYLFLRDREMKLIPKSILILLGIIVSIWTTTRAQNLTLIMLFSYILFEDLNPKIKKYFTAIFSVSFFILIWWLSNNTSVFSFSDYGNFAKIGHITSYYKILDLKSFIFGQGPGSLYYSSGFGEKTSITEVTLLDNIRYIGVIMTAIMYYFIYFPTGKIIIKREETVVLTLYIIMSFTNPILFTSAGLLVIVWYWSSINFNNEKNLIENKQEV